MSETTPTDPTDPNPRDRYGIADKLARAFERSLGGISLDPFCDPGQAIRCRHGFTIHKGEHPSAGKLTRRDSLEGEDWNKTIGVRTAYVNPKFSGKGTELALARTVDLVTIPANTGLCEAAIFVGPANLGAKYWRDSGGHEALAAVAHLGRYDFLPLVDMPATDTAKARKRGARSTGGSSVEVIAVLLSRADFRAPYVERFDRAMRSMGVAVTFARGA